MWCSETPWFFLPFFLFIHMNNIWLKVFEFVCVCVFICVLGLFVTFWGECFWQHQDIPTPSWTACTQLFNTVFPVSGGWNVQCCDMMISLICMQVNETHSLMKNVVFPDSQNSWWWSTEDAEINANVVFDLFLFVCLLFVCVCVIVFIVLLDVMWLRIEERQKRDLQFILIVIFFPILMPKWECIRISCVWFLLCFVLSYSFCGVCQCCLFAVTHLVQGGRFCLLRVFLCHHPSFISVFCLKSHAFFGLYLTFFTVPS